MDEEVKVISLNDLPKEIQEELKNNKEYKKKINSILKDSRTKAKKEKCYYCGKEVTSFCNSHTVPLFCLKNIATNGEVLTLNALVQNPVLDEIVGLKKAGTFQIICNECDNTIFQDYENPDNYEGIPTQKMLAQIALKNSLKMISKRYLETELYNTVAERNPLARPITEIKNSINELDLCEFIDSFNKAKTTLLKNKENQYYICYYKKLDYVVPIAFQGPITLTYDFEGNIINNTYNYSADYKTKAINILVLPLKDKTIIMMFIEQGDKRYRQFYKQFNKLDLNNQLTALNYIIFVYSEDMYISKSLEGLIKSNDVLCNIGKTGQDVLSTKKNVDGIKAIKEYNDLNKRNSIPNLLSEEYKLERNNN